MFSLVSYEFVGNTFMYYINILLKFINLSNIFIDNKQLLYNIYSYCKRMLEVSINNRN